MTVVAASSPALAGVEKTDAVKEDFDEAQAVAAMRARRFGDRFLGAHRGGVEKARRCGDRVTSGGVLGRDERTYVVEREGALRAEEAVMTHLLETRRQHMLEEPPEELERVELHRAPAPRARLLPAKAHTSGVQRDDAGVGDRNAEDAAREAAERRASIAVRSGEEKEVRLEISTGGGIRRILTSESRPLSQARFSLAEGGAVAIRLTLDR